MRRFLLSLTPYDVAGGASALLIGLGASSWLVGFGVLIGFGAIKSSVEDALNNR